MARLVGNTWINTRWSKMSNIAKLCSEMVVWFLEVSVYDILTVVGGES